MRRSGRPLPRDRGARARRPPLCPDRGRRLTMRSGDDSAGGRTRAGAGTDPGVRSAPRLIRAACLLMAAQVLWSFPGDSRGQAPPPAREAGPVTYPRGAYAMAQINKNINENIKKNKYIVGVALQFNWRDIEKEKGRFDWSNLDARV